MDWEKLGIIVAVIMSLATAIKVIWFMPKESKQLDKNIDKIVADTADTFERVATSAAERALKLDARLTSVEDENIKVKCELEAVKIENVELKQSVKILQDERITINIKLRQLEKENKSLKKWAEKLVDQVKEWGGQPVPFDPNIE